MSVSQVYNMDCMEALKEFPDGYFELCIADPPYGISITDRHRSQSLNVEREREADAACRRRRQTVRRYAEATGAGDHRFGGARLFKRLQEAQSRIKILSCVR